MSRLWDKYSNKSCNCLGDLARMILCNGERGDGLKFLRDQKNHWNNPKWTFFHILADCEAGGPIIPTSTRKELVRYRELVHCGMMT